MTVLKPEVNLLRDYGKEVAIILFLHGKILCHVITTEKWLHHMAIIFP